MRTRRPQTQPARPIERHGRSGRDRFGLACCDGSHPPERLGRKLLPGTPDFAACTQHSGTSAGTPAKFCREFTEFFFAFQHGPTNAD
jgi:hypothetical protein